MNKPGYARQEANPMLRKQALRLLLLFHVRTETERFVPESALSAASGHIVYMRQTSGVMVIIPDGWTNKHMSDNVITSSDNVINVRRGNVILFVLPDNVTNCTCLLIM